MITATRNNGNPAMTADQARSFQTYSLPNAAMVAMQLRCGCEPYRDVFTYNRWRAQGYQVQRGEKAIHLPLVKTVVKETTDDDTGEVIETPRRILGSSAVFCRCQVKAIKK